jgi:hypothetical protein
MDLYFRDGSDIEFTDRRQPEGDKELEKFQGKWSEPWRFAKGWK